MHQYAPNYAPRPVTPDPSFTPIQALLPLLSISKRRLRQLETTQLVRERRENRRQDIAYKARPFVLCGLPLRQPPKHQLVYTRRNGHFQLEITAHPRFGLPYGQDRLIPIWLATLAHKQKGRTLHFDSPTQLLDYFRLPKDGAQYRRIRAAFQRVFAATIFFGTDDALAKQGLVDSTRFHFLDQMQLWFNCNEKPEPTGSQALDNVVLLSEAFYREIREHPIPVERDVIAALAHAPGLLDFYVWIAWKSWTVNGRPAQVPIFGPNGLCNQLGTAQYSVNRLFRHKIAQWLRQVKALWPECPAEVSEDGHFLVVRSSRKSTAVRPVERPVNP
ncbi:MAG: replication protein RepA [Terriglobia bacterium]